MFVVLGVESIQSGETNDANFRLLDIFCTYPCLPFLWNTDAAAVTRKAILLAEQHHAPKVKRGNGYTGAMRT